MALRFGLLGTGYWAAQTQAAALATHEGVDFVGVWGRSPAPRAALAQRYGVTDFPDLDALLAVVDAVAVALPPDVQAEVAHRAAAAGKHLLLDKPLAFTVEAADRVVAEVERHNLSSVIFFTRLFNESIGSFLTQAAATGGWDGGAATHCAQIFGAGNPYGASVWRKEKGGLWDVGPHALSMLLPVLGPVAEVAAFDAPHATTHVLSRHICGAVSTMVLTLDSPPAAAHHETVFYGEAGRQVVPDTDRSSVEAFGGAIDQVLRGGPNPCDVHFGREVVAVLAAAELARGNGMTVPVRPRQWTAT